MSSPPSVALFQTHDDARAHSVAWMGAYKERSPHGWRWDTASSLFCEPVPQLPCYVMPLVTGDRSGGYAALLAFTVGVKYEGRYWQGRVPDADGAPVLSENVLDALDSILGVLFGAAQLSHGAPHSSP